MIEFEDLPPHPAAPSVPASEPLERWGLAWKGHDHAVCERMADGYWTPWHIADVRDAHLRALLNAADNVTIAAGMGWELDGVLQKLEDARAAARGEDPREIGKVCAPPTLTAAERAVVEHLRSVICPKTTEVLAVLAIIDRLAPRAEGEEGR